MNAVGDILLKNLLPKKKLTANLNHIEVIKEAWLSSATYEQVQHRPADIFNKKIERVYLDLESDKHDGATSKYTQVGRSKSEYRPTVTGPKVNSKIAGLQIAQRPIGNRVCSMDVDQNFADNKREDRKIQQNNTDDYEVDAEKATIPQKMRMSNNTNTQFRSVKQDFSDSSGLLPNIAHNNSHRNQFRAPALDSSSLRLLLN